MGDSILGLLQLNQGVQYNVVIPICLGYIVFFWLIVSIWVAYDARKRFHNPFVIFLMFIGNLVFLVPFLLLYLLFRPIEDEYSEGQQEQQGGVNVPIVNFTGPEGVVMSLELKINGHRGLMPQNASEMKIDVSFDSQDVHKQIAQPVALDRFVEGEVKTKTDLKKVFERLLGKIKSITIWKKKDLDNGDANDKDVKSVIDIDQNAESKKKKKKKHRR